jgi:hypothetical protein
VHDVRRIGSGWKLYGEPVERQARGLCGALAHAQSFRTGKLTLGDLVASRTCAARPVETLPHLRYTGRRRQCQKVRFYGSDKIARIALEPGNIAAHACHATGQIVAFLDQLRRQLPGIDRRQRFVGVCRGAATVALVVEPGTGGCTCRIT